MIMFIILMLIVCVALGLLTGLAVPFFLQGFGVPSLLADWIGVGITVGIAGFLGWYVPDFLIYIGVPFQ